jgi:hypothetical protein
MPRGCTICDHPQHEAIDQAFVAGQSLRDIAGHYHLSKSALARHKESHAPPALIQDTVDLETRLQKARAEDQRRYTHLLWDARAVMCAMEGWRGSDLETEAGWRQACEEARQRYHSGRFLIERIGAERFLEPQLMAILWQLRQTLVDEYAAQAPTATMLIDLAVMTYYNALRVQAWIGDLALHIEHEFFCQEGPTAKLRQKWGYQVEGLVVEESLQRLAEQLMPLFERANRQLIRNLQALRTLRHGPLPAVAIGHAGQVNPAQQQMNLTHGGRNGTGEHRS